MMISRAPVFPTMFKATVEIERNQISDQKEWLIVQKGFSCDDAIKILLQQFGYNLTTVSRTLQGAKFSAEVKIAVNITGKQIVHTQSLLVFTGFPVHVHALFGIDTSRAHLPCTSVGLTSGSQDE